MCSHRILTQLKSIPVLPSQRVHTSHNVCFIESQDSKTQLAAPKRPTVINVDTRDDDEEDNIYQVSPGSPNTEESGTPVSPDPITQDPSEHEVTVLIDEPNETPNPNPPP